MTSLNDSKNMDQKNNRIAASANISVYDAEMTEQYVDGAPHLKHASLNALYHELVLQVFDSARQYVKTPTVLDLGAGEGSMTLPFLEHGANVVAIDASSSQIDALRSKCERFSEQLEFRCEDINDVLREEGKQYDIVVVNSFLHHVPDYISMISEAIAVLGPHGQFFSFQDPIRYDSIGKPAMLFSNIAYFSWRIFKGDLVGGLMRRLRRRRGIYLEDSVHDNAEYHVTRNGVDQDAIRMVFEEHGFDCNIVYYFSAQSRFFQIVGNALGVKNTFAVISQKRAIAESAELGQNSGNPSIEKS